MRNAIAARTAAGLLAVTLLLAACGQATDLHQAAGKASTATPVPPPGRALLPPAGNNGPVPAGQPANLPSPVQTGTPPLLRTAGCSALTREAIYDNPIPLPNAVQTAGPLPVAPAPPLRGAMDQPATFIVTSACSERILEMATGDTLEVVLVGTGQWSATHYLVYGQDVLQSIGLVVTANGGRWRYRAVQKGGGALQIDYKPSCVATPCAGARRYLNLGVQVR